MAILDILAQIELLVDYDTKLSYSLLKGYSMTYFQKLKRSRGPHLPKTEVHEQVYYQGCKQVHDQINIDVQIQVDKAKSRILGHIYNNVRK